MSTSRLTAEVISRSPAFFNALKDRELDLRGNQIAVIENLSATQDQFDSIDLSDNAILKLECTAPLPRLKQLLLNNNRVMRINDGLTRALPNLTTLVLTNNNLATLTQLEPLAQLQSLVALSLVDNPVTKVADYRAFVIALLPKLRVLDYQRVKLAERDAALRKVGRKPNGVRGGAVRGPGGAPTAPVKAAPTEEQVAQMRAAIANASSLEEVQKLQKALEAGNFEAISKAAEAASGGS